jgi:hypothetical protein
LSYLAGLLPFRLLCCLQTGLFLDLHLLAKLLLTHEFRQSLLPVEHFRLLHLPHLFRELEHLHHLNHLPGLPRAGLTTGHAASRSAAAAHTATHSHACHATAHAVSLAHAGLLSHCRVRRDEEQAQRQRAQAESHS